ncbi:MAG TPA: hypothetical protein VHE55_05915 [Fimbriimonadaceae bacterium]|nr:hypothetical protein [Fimbriimonadaceae bacterium]
MKLGTAFASIAMISVVAFAGAQGKPTKPVMKMAPHHKVNWQQMYDKAAKDFDSRNTDAIFSYMTPDFTMTMGGQTMTTEQAKGQMKAWMSMMKSVHCTFKIKKVSEAGGMTMVVDDFMMTGMSKPNPKTHKSDKYVDAGTEQATWVQMNGKWMMKKLVSVKEKMTKNGKPFNPSSAAN